MKRRVIQNHSVPVAVPVLVVTEVAYLLGSCLECFVTSGNDKPRAWTGQSSIPARSSTAGELFTTWRFIVEHVGDFLGFPGSDRSERFEEVQAARVVEGGMKADELAG